MAKEINNNSAIVVTDENGVTTKIEARAYPIAEPKGSTLGFASISIDDKFAINGVRVVQGKEGLFAAMPQTKDAKGEFRDICFPTTKELRQAINDKVLGEYAIAIDAMVAEKESAANKLREAATVAKTNTAQTTVKDKKKTGLEL